MGFWSKLKSAIGIAVSVAPILPLPGKVKTVIGKVGEVEAAVEKNLPKKKRKRR